MSLFNLLAAHERAVVYTLGRVSGVKGPGLVLLVPMLQTMKRVDMRERVAQARNATVTYRVADPARVLEQVSDYHDAMGRLAESALARALAGRDADALVFERAGIAEAMRTEMEAACAPWGIAIVKLTVNR